MIKLADELEAANWNGNIPRRWQRLDPRGGSGDRGEWRLPTGRNYRWKSWGISGRNELKSGRDGALINTDGVKWKFHCDQY